MASKGKLMGSGMAAQAANNIVGDVNNGATATGTNLATAYPLNDITEFTTVASGTGAALPGNANLGDSCLVYNGGSNALLIYPQTVDSINALTAAATLSVSANKCILFTKVGATRWASILTA